MAKKNPIAEWKALSEAQKQAQIAKLDAGEYTPRPLTASEKTQWRKTQAALRFNQNNYLR